MYVSKRHLFLINITLFLAIVLVSSGCDAQSKPEKIAQHFLSLWQNQQYADMYELLTTDAKVSVDKQAFVERYKNIFNGIGLQSMEYKIDTPSISYADKNTALIPVDITFQTSTVGSMAFSYKIQLSRNNKIWGIEWDSTLILPKLAANYKVKVSRQQPERGIIFDRNGTPLATQGEVLSIGVVTGKIKDESFLQQQLSQLLFMQPEEIKAKYTQSWVKPDLFVPIRLLPADTSDDIKQKLLTIPGVMISKATDRVYPYKSAMAQLIGYVGDVSQEELAKPENKGLKAGDKIGKSGLEAAFNKVLSGIPGFTISIVDEQGNEKYKVGQRSKQNASDIYTTIDIELQQQLEKAMADKKGAAVIMKPKSGEILAITSHPNFDPNMFSLGMSSEQWKTINEDPQKPLLNRAIRSSYPPGSTFKPITAVAGLDSGIIDPNETIDTSLGKWQASSLWGNYYVTRVERPGKPAINMHDAMIWSDNIYFAQIALRMGKNTILDYAKRFGFGQSIPFPLSVTKPVLSSDGNIKDDISLADSGYGQGEIITTPLHMSMVYSAFANGGMLPKPLIVSRIQDEDGNIIEQNSPAVWLSTGIKPQTLSTITLFLQDVIEQPTGTGHAAKLSGVSLAGKTGTAEISSDKSKPPIGWFISYGPTDNPQAVIAVSIEDASSGSHDALPVAKTLWQYILNDNG
ncbi:penicillin-binding transpeptidase domain-containing protein [Mahella australiensis]|uniref:Penicillin-binding protein transpeptidase n=1 Tax=Mahella australiensis (strain DSM 15567 / CIP 107919 / 50-1 BON) TaxID=697281 RepID=F3ZYY9_MAHA5|nr:penicillin-binding transpeptidase domain-containing protein [Mahella australiensis]AEE96748.1 penicillin-binding protein transpeptidase [Mahella australiensis 50-1 BON]